MHLAQPSTGASPARQRSSSTSRSRCRLHARRGCRCHTCRPSRGRGEGYEQRCVPPLLTLAPIPHPSLSPSHSRTHSRTVVAAPPSLTRTGPSLGAEETSRSISIIVCLVYAAGSGPSSRIDAALVHHFQPRSSLLIVDPPRSIHPVAPELTVSSGVSSSVLCPSFQARFCAISRYSISVLWPELRCYRCALCRCSRPSRS